MRSVDELVKIVENQGRPIGDNKKFYYGTSFPESCRKCIESCREASKKAKLQGRVIVPTWICSRCPCTVEDFND